MTLNFQPGGAERGKASSPGFATMPLVRLLALLLLGLFAACGSRPAGPADRPLHIGGSGSARDVVEQLIASYRMVCPKRERVEHVPSTHSGAALTALRAGELDVAYVTREPRARERRGLYVYPYALDPVVFAVHAGTGVADLSVADLRRIYRGEVVRWSQLGGADVPIAVLDRPEYTSPKVLLRAGPFASLAVRADALVFETQDHLDAALYTLPGAIGYTSLRDALARAPGVVVLRIDGVYPGPDTVRSGEYPWARTLSFVVRDGFPLAAKRFLDYVMSPEGRHPAQDAAMVPVRRELRLAVPPARNIVAQEIKYGGLARYLQVRLGRPVELVHQPSYTALTEAFRQNRVDAGFLGSLEYVVAREEAGVEVLARPDYGGVSQYRGVLYVRADSPYRSVEDLRGRDAAYAGPGTTAGQVFPLYLLRTSGLPPPERFFGRYLAAESHEGALRALLEGRVEAAAAKDLVWREMVSEDPDLEGRLRVLAVSLPVPSNALATSLRVDPSLRDQIRGLLLSMDQSPYGRRALVEMGADRFVPTTDADYGNLYRMLETVSADLAGFFQYR